MKLAPLTALVLICGMTAGCTALTEPTNDTGAELAAAHAAKVSLLDAVATAKKHSDGTPANVDFEEENGIYYYEVRFLTFDRSETVLVDSATAEVPDVRSEHYASKSLRARFGNMRATLKGAKVSLSGAIQIAQNKAGGAGFETHIDDVDRPDHMIVEVATANAIEPVTVKLESVE
ncbi:PepSY domain-containing protein [Parvibaculum sp. MBR-TMA-1.3b-4.2]|jgi:S-adenosylhomocysteine hydrolase